MQGLELARQYYEQYGRPLLENQFFAQKNRIAVGLVGDGSECFGFDDQISQDHDWGAGFYFWLTPEDYQQIGAELQAAYQALPSEFAGFPKRTSTEFDGERGGVWQIQTFYHHFLALEQPPATWQQWRSLPESNLAAATNGEVFSDPLGEFTAFRNQLLEFYPEDLRLKKIAARCMIMGQAGQYNYVRSVARKEWVAAHQALSEFINAAVSAIYLANKRYKPFYKWMHRGLKSLPLGGEQFYEMFRNLTKCTNKPSPYEKNIQLIEDICQGIIALLQHLNLTDSNSSFILDHAAFVQSRIQEDNLKRLPLIAE